MLAEIDHADVLKPLDQRGQRQAIDNRREARLREHAGHRLGDRSDQGSEGDAPDDHQRPHRVVVRTFRFHIPDQRDIKTELAESLDRKEDAGRQGDQAEILRHQQSREEDRADEAKPADGEAHEHHPCRAFGHLSADSGIRWVWRRHAALHAWPALSRWTGWVLRPGKAANRLRVTCAPGRRIDRDMPGLKEYC